MTRQGRANCAIGVALVTLVLSAGCGSQDPADDSMPDWNLVQMRRSMSSGSVVSIAFSPDRLRSAVVCFPAHRSSARSSPAFIPSGVLETWDDEGLYSQRLSALTIHDLKWQPIGFFRDGRRVHFWGIDRVVAWDMERFRLETEAFLGVRALSPDGRLAVVEDLSDIRGINDSAVIRDSGKKLWVVEVPSGAVVSQVAFGGSELSPQIFSPDGTLLVVAVHQSYYWKELLLWDVKSGEVRQRRPVSGNAASFAFSGDGTRLACAWENGVIEIWNDIDGSTVNSMQPRTDQLRGIALSPDGRLLATGIEKDEKGAIALVWDVDKGQLVTRIKAAEEWGATAVSFTPDGVRLAVGCPSGDLRFFEVPLDWVRSQSAKEDVAHADL